MAELENFNVFVNEKMRGWRADGKAFPTHRRIPGDGDAVDALAAQLDEAAVDAMLKERAELRKDGDYDSADALVRRLRDEFNVALDDKKGTWRLVVMHGGYYQVGPAVSEAVSQTVNELLERRTAHREAE
eukprot:2715561-Prymnesium_polylepis.1